MDNVSVDLLTYMALSCSSLNQAVCAGTGSDSTNEYGVNIFYLKDDHTLI